MPCDDCAERLIGVAGESCLGCPEKEQAPSEEEQEPSDPELLDT